MRDNEVYAVQEQRFSQNLESYYLKCFNTKFKGEALITDEDRPVLVWLAKNLGIAKGEKVIEHYFRMSDDWFIQNAYSLIVLKKNVNKVLASMGNRTEPGGKGAKMQMPIACDKCFGYYNWEGYAAELEKARICEKCK